MLCWDHCTGEGTALKMEIRPVRERIRVQRGLLAVLFLFLAVPGALAQDRFSNWLNEDGLYLLSTKQREAFLSLTSDEEKDAFIRAVWTALDPTPETEQNEFRDEWQSRVQYARDRYGLRSDRGRAGVILGPPASISRLAQDRSVVPLECWEYSALKLPGLPSQLALLFFKQFGVGDYRLYSPALDGPGSLVIRPMSTRTDGEGEDGEFLRRHTHLDARMLSAAASMSPGYSTFESEAIAQRLQWTYGELIAGYPKTRVEATVTHVGTAAPAGAQSQPVVLAPPSPVQQAPFAERNKLDAVLDRAAHWVDGFRESFSRIIAEEHYTQEVLDANGVTRKSRRLESDVLLLWWDTARAWVVYRDVFKVDGKPVRDREERIQKLFLQPFATAVEQAKQIATESAQYNIGNVYRDFNVPTRALIHLDPANRSRCQFTKKAEGMKDGVCLWRVEFAETTPPSLYADRSGRDLFARGELELEPGTGVMHRTVLVVEDTTADLRAEIAVEYGMDKQLGMIVPTKMWESYDHPKLADLYMKSGAWRPALIGSRSPQSLGVPGVITGRAVYSNFKRLEVRVQEQVRPPQTQPAERRE